MKFLKEIQAFQVSEDTTTEMVLLLANNTVKKRDLSNLYLKDFTINLPGIFNNATAQATPSNRTLNFSLKSQTRRSVFAAPNGSNGTPDFRALLLDDIADYSQANVNYWTRDVGGTLSFMNGGIALGSTGNTFQSIRLIRDITGNVNSCGVGQFGMYKSDVTSSATNFYSQTKTEPSSFVLNSFRHFLAEQYSIGAGSSINSQVGFYATSTLVGATNNYGFFGDIPSGTNRWNLYMNGTARNYLAGKLHIGNTGDYSSAMLQVTGKGSFSDNVVIGSNTEFLNTYKLQVLGDGYFKGSKVVIGDAGYTNKSLIFRDESNVGSGIGFSTVTDGLVISAGSLKKIVFSAGFKAFPSDILNNTSDIGVAIVQNKVGIANLNPLYELDIVGSLAYSVLLRPNGNAGTNGQFLKTTGTANAWASLTAGDLTDFTSAVNTLISQGQVASNYWTKTGNNLSYIAGNVGVGAEPTTNKFFVYQSSVLGQFIVGHAGLSRTFIDQDEFYIRSGADASKKNKVFFGNGQTQHYGSFTVNSYTDTAFGKVRLQPGTASNSGYLEIINSSNLRLGYVGFDNTNLNYIVENNAMHYFGGGNVLIGYNQSRGSYQLQVDKGAYIQNTVADGIILKLKDSVENNGIDIYNFGMYFSRQASYLNPTVNDFSALYIGQASDTKRWNAIVLEGSVITLNSQKNYALLKTDSTGVIQQAIASDVISVLGDSYIKNQSASAQPANMWISGNAKVNSTLMVGNDVQDAIFRVYSGLAGMRIGYNNSSQNYFDADIQMFRNIAGAEVMRTMSLKLLIGNQSERGPFQLQVAGSALVQDIWIHQGGHTTSVFVGQSSGANSTGSGNSGFGANSLVSNTTGTSNVAVGFSSMNSNQTGIANVAVGQDTLFHNVSGQFNSAIGYQSMVLSVKANFSVANGAYAMYYSNDSYAVAIGTSALRYNGSNSGSTYNSFNVAIGYAAMNGNTLSGYESDNYFFNNVAIGAYTMHKAKTVTYSVAVGMSSLQEAFTSTHNTSVGYESQYLNTTGSYNVTLGSWALKNNQTSNGHTAIGMSALKNLTTGDYNVGLGTNAGINLTNGGFNLFLGAVNCGLNISTGSANVIIGSNTGTRINGLSNYMIFSDGSGAERFSVTNTGYMLIGRTDTIGAYRLQVNGTIQIEAVKSAIVKTNALGAMEAATKQDFQTLLGDDSYILNQTATAQPGGFYVSGNGYASGGFFATGNVSSGSDRRLKSNIVPLLGIRDRVKDLELKSYIKFGQKDLGYIAQDLQEIFPELVSEYKNGYLGINYGGVAALALQLGNENANEIDNLKQEIQRLKEKLNEHGIAA